jgi:plasmid stability protein
MSLTIELPDEQQAALAAKARARGLSAEEYVRQMVEHDLQPPRRHVWDIIADNMKDVPPEDFAALPKDGLSQIDHYVYGTPKTTP